MMGPTILILLPRERVCEALPNNEGTKTVDSGVVVYIYQMLTRNRQTENKNLVMGSGWEPDTKTDWPTDRRS
jgi:hypothetical protein